MDNAYVKNIAVICAIFLSLSWQTIRAESTDSLDDNNRLGAGHYQQWVNDETPTSLPPMREMANNTTRVIPAQPEMSDTNEVPIVKSAPLSYRRSQRIMLNSAPPGIPSGGPEAETAFNALMHQNIPLTPKQVVRLRQLIDSSQRAAAISPTVPPKPVSTTIMMNLAPGATPPAIRLAQGYVSSLVFVDSTGEGWPIASYDIGDPKATNIQWDGKSNVLLVQAVSPYGDSNIVVRLIGLMTPITLELVAGQRVVDFRSDIHVPGMGPNAKDLPAGSNLPDNANQLLLNILDGVAPPGSKLLTVTGGDCQAWLFGNKMYLRSRLTVLSPGWIGRMVSPDGMFAYEIQKSSTVLVSQYGNPIELKIEGF
ncbi:MAG: DotH/IcmK family type IV secretion protein [Gammaproteobacteria bacterium]|nr:DotH/IcmK family type IV secretion protein [Gammaproteobacteria bacterium]